MRVYPHKTEVRREDLVYPELSYRIIGALLEVFNALGYRYKELHYQRALAKVFREERIPFKEQVSTPVMFRGEVIGRYVFDFLIDDKLVLEIKRGDGFRREDIQQVVNYLRSANLKLGIIARFSSKGIKTKRILNLY